MQTRLRVEETRGTCPIGRDECLEAKSLNVGEQTIALAKKYLSRPELERDRPKLDITKPIPLSEFAGLVCSYEFKPPEHVHCQLLDDKGRCNHKHGIGYVGCLKTDTEGYIGHMCAADHFKDHENFRTLFTTERVRVEREADTERLIGRLSHVLASPGSAETVEALLLERQRQWDEATRVRRLLGPKLLRIIEERGKRRDLAVRIKIEIVETEIDERTKRQIQRITYQPVVWGYLVGIDGLDHKPLDKIGGRLQEAKSALKVAAASPDQTDVDMSRWAQALEYVPMAGKNLAERKSLLDGFCKPDVLKLLWLFDRDRFTQIAIANAVIEIATRRRPAEYEGAEHRAAWETEIRAANQGREFQVE
jgi:hypothetical protein